MDMIAKIAQRFRPENIVSFEIAAQINAVSKALVGEVTYNVDIENQLINRVYNIVIKFYDVTLPELISKSRKRHINEPRQIIMALSKEISDTITLKHIGDTFGNRDHSTVLHAMQAIKDLAHTNRKFKKKYNEIREDLGLEIIL